MQHHSSPTRLLDITKNPLVALYFATKNYKNNQDSIVYIIKPKKTDDAYKNILYSDSDKALMLASLAKFTQKEKDELESVLSAFIGSTTGPITQIPINSLQNKNDLSYKILQKYIHEIQTENPAFVPYIVPEDIFKKYIVQPEKTNNRIIKQDGAFIIWGLEKKNFDFVCLTFNELSQYIKFYDQNISLDILLDCANKKIENILTGINLDIKTSINLNIKPRIKNCKSKEELEKLLGEIIIEIKENILLIDGLEIKHLIIPADKKETIHDELDLLNINEASLFPEIDNVANYLKEHL